MTQDKQPITEDKSKLIEMLNSFPYIKIELKDEILQIIQEYPKLVAIRQSFEDLRVAYDAIVEEGTKLKEIVRQYDHLDDVCGYCNKTALSLGIKTILQMSHHIHDCKHDLIPQNPLEQENQKLKAEIQLYELIQMQRDSLQREIEELKKNADLWDEHLQLQNNPNLKKVTMTYQEMRESKQAIEIVKRLEEKSKPENVFDIVNDELMPMTNKVQNQIEITNWVLDLLQSILKGEKK